MKRPPTDAELMSRANAYAEEVVRGVNSINGAQLAPIDVARAFVIGYAAGLEAGAVIARNDRVARGRSK